MAGINQGRPELAVGEPIRLGSNDEFEIEQHPISDRLIIRDTQNGKVAYVRKERGGQIGGDGVLIKALKESKPMADDGRTYDTIQQAEREASAWVFVPPGTFNESVTIDTEGLTLRGSGYNTELTKLLRTRQDDITVSNLSITTEDVTIDCFGDNFTISNVVAENTIDDGDVLDTSGDNSLIYNCTFIGGDRGIEVRGENVIITNNTLKNTSYVGSTGGHTILMRDPNQLVANNVLLDNNDNGISPFESPNSIIIGNRIINTEDFGIRIYSGTNDCIVANNRISDSGNSDIQDDATGTILDANLTGSAN